MKKILLLAIALGMSMGNPLSLCADQGDDLLFLLEPDSAKKTAGPIKPSKVAVDDSDSAASTKNKANSDDIDLATLETVVAQDEAAVKPETIVYPPAPEDKEPEKKEDPSITFYKKLASSAKGLTYDQLPQPLKDSIEKAVLPPIKNYLKQNIQFTNLSFERPSKGVFKIIGDFVLYGQKVRGIIREMTPEKGAPKYSFILEFSDAIRLSSIAKELKIIDLNVEHLQMVFSNWEYEDAELGGVKVAEGLNLVGDVLMEGTLQPIQKLTKLKKVRMYGTIKDELVGSTINGMIPGRLSLGNGVVLTKMMVGVEIVGKLPLNTPFPQFLLKGALDVKIKGQENPVSFDSRLEIGAEKATLSGFMAGTWNNPFGIKGLSIGDVGVSAGVLYVGVLDGLGLKGTIKMGDKLFIMATKGSVTEGAAFVGELQGELSYKDIVMFANKSMGNPLPVDEVFKVIPNVSLKNAKLQIVPVTTVIIGESYPQGITFDGGITLFGKTTDMHIMVLKDGIKGRATLPEIEVKDLFSLKGIKDSSGELQLPQVSLDISRASSKIASMYVKGVITLAPIILGGATADGYIDFSPFGTDILMKAKLFDQFMFDLDLKSKVSLSVAPANLTIKASMDSAGGIGQLADRLRDLTKSVLGDPKELQGAAQEETLSCVGLK